MKMINNWDNVLKKAWSAYAIYVLTALNGLYAIWPAFQGTIPLWALATGSILLAFAALGLRVVDQGGLSK